MAVTYFPPITPFIHWGDITGNISNQTDLSAEIADLLKLSGRSGGQEAIGGTGEDEGLTFRTSSFSASTNDYFKIKNAAEEIIFNLTHSGIIKSVS
ncbi:MAG: hypothetical protein QG635_1577, partial [Bacteroidota bacterium]|nr:hypothetical protein [Bacteroidota bacterium]